MESTTCTCGAGSGSIRHLSFCALAPAYRGDEAVERVSLSVMASRIAELRRAEAYAGEELDAYYAPSECYGDVYRGYARDEQRLLRDGGWGPHEYNEALAARTSERFAYFSGLAVDEDPEPETLERIDPRPGRRTVRVRGEVYRGRGIAAARAYEADHPLEAVIATWPGRPGSGTLVLTVTDRKR